jgi:glyoxylase-like metal-dependent hydrolase (beta-lactamase superfamily II)/8-oxo-dGTP pyrophosphatase MutT (NUDIX family)
VVVLLRNPDDPEVFWVRRSDAVPNQPGFHAFLGGTLAPGDSRLELEGVPDGPERWVRACALREALEEAGVLIGVRGTVTPEQREEARRLLLAGDTSLAEVAERFGWRFDGRALLEAGRWVTPAFAIVRFSAWYFLAWLPAGETPEVRPGELADGEWIRPAQALERWRQGEVTFVTPILHTLQAVALGAEGLVVRMRALPEAASRPPHRVEMKRGILLCSLAARTLPPATHTNCYLIGDREVAVLDPGSDDPEQLQLLFTLIAELAGQGRAPRCVLLTHHHPDHVAGARAVSQRYGVPVWAHAETGQHVRVDAFLADGDRVPLAGEAHDWTLRAVHTPGHARGHLCFLHEPTRSLFTGDHVVGTGTVVIDPPEGDMADYMASLERLLALPVETLFPAHGSPRGAAKRAIRALLDHRRRREAKVLSALGVAPASAEDLLPVVYADTPEPLWPLARRSLAAHLDKLVREGRARADGGTYRRVEGEPG